VVDRLDGDAPPDPVAAGDLDRLAGDRHQCVHEARVHLAPHPDMHAAHRAAEHQAQMLDAEFFGDETDFRRNDVAVAIRNEFGL